jgi:CheY-like chemotaxis protein
MALGGKYGALQRKDRQGSIFWFAIPYIPDTVTAAHAAMAAAHTHGSSMNSMNSTNSPARSSTNSNSSGGTTVNATVPNHNNHQRSHMMVASFDANSRSMSSSLESATQSMSMSLSTSSRGESHNMNLNMTNGGVGTAVSSVLKPGAMNGHTQTQRPQQQREQQQQSQPLSRVQEFAGASQSSDVDDGFGHTVVMSAPQQQQQRQLVRANTRAQASIVRPFGSDDDDFDAEMSTSSHYIHTDHGAITVRTPQNFVPLSAVAINSHAQAARASSLLGLGVASNRTASPSSMSKHGSMSHLDGGAHDHSGSSTSANHGGSGLLSRQTSGAAAGGAGGSQQQLLSSSHAPSQQLSSDRIYPVSRQRSCSSDGYSTHMSHITSGSCMRVLIVDDSASILKLSSMMLKRKGYDVDTAENGALALIALRNNGPFDVVLMDIQMPVMDGLECTRRIREQELTSEELVYSHNRSGPVSKQNSTAYEIKDKEKEKEKLRSPGKNEASTSGGVAGMFSSLLSPSKPTNASSSSSNNNNTNNNKDTILAFNKSQSHNFEVGSNASDASVRRQFIIGLSACSDNETIAQAFAAGIDVFISKPFTMDSFKSAILHRYHAQQND